jgi:hypothetical protein
VWIEENTLLRVPFLILLFCAVAVPQPPPVRPISDPVRAAEIQQRADLQPADLTKAYTQLHQRQFSARFNHLVDAVSDFSKRYNEGKGAVWPHREAVKLRKALQELEKSLRDEP